MKNFKTLLYGLIVISGLIVGFTGCDKEEFDEPPYNEAGELKTIAQIRALYQGADIRFDTNYSVYATVTMDDKSGNIYKTCYIQDSSGAIALHMLSSGSIYQGDSIRIDLNGLILTSYGGALQLDSINPDRNIYKQATQKIINPKVVQINDLLTQQYEAHLIQLNGVEFSDIELGQTYADGVNDVSLDRTVQDCNGNTVIVRTSGYADFADVTIAGGNGSIVFIASQYNGTVQLTIRSLAEVKLDTNRCDGSSGTGTALLQENFETVPSGGVVSLSGWKNIAQKGANKWVGSYYDSNNSASFSAYYSIPGDTNIVWLITPAVNLNGSTAEAVNFLSQAGFANGAVLDVFVSTGYDGSDTPWTSTWDQKSPTVAVGTSLGYGDWETSGSIDISSYSGNIYVAFRYTGVGGSKTTTFKVDNVRISGEL